MRALVLTLALAGCGLQANPPPPPDRIEAAEYICTEPGMVLEVIETAGGDTLAACVPSAEHALVREPAPRSTLRPDQ